MRGLVENQVSATHFEKGRGPSWKKRGDTSIPSPLHQEILNYIKPVICGGRALDRKGNPLYVELVFRGDDQAAQILNAIKMCRAFSSKDRTLGKLVRALEQAPHLNQVYTVADLSHPHGKFFEDLASAQHINHLKGLLINMIGGQNAIMCTACIKSYMTNITMEKEHFLYPFHACKSITGIIDGHLDGQCGCCVWRGEGHCEWATIKGYVATSANEGTPTWRLGGATTFDQEDPQGWSKDQLNRVSAPRLTFDWPVIRKPSESADAYDKRVKTATKAIERQLEGMHLLD